MIAAKCIFTEMDMGLEHRIWNDDFKRVNGKCSAVVYFVALTAFFEGSSIQTTIYLSVFD